jgi:hypothetical protein
MTSVRKFRLLLLIGILPSRNYLAAAFSAALAVISSGTPTSTRWANTRPNRLVSYVKSPQNNDPASDGDDEVNNDDNGEEEPEFITKEMF